jgi:hypothetical protein
MKADKKTNLHRRVEGFRSRDISFRLAGRMSALPSCRSAFPIELYSDITELPMSLKRLTPGERATYLLGLAVRRQLEEGPRDPDTLREIAPVCRWMEQWLNEWELLLIAQGTGHYFGDEGDEPDLFETTSIRRGPS